MCAWMGFTIAIAVLGTTAALVAFKIAHNTHRRDRKADIRAISDAALGGGPVMVKEVGDALAKLIHARGRAPRWRSFKDDNPTARASTHQVEQTPRSSDGHTA